MNCTEVQTRLSAFYDDELPAEEAARVAAHLSNCTVCGSEFATFGQLSGLSQQLSDPQVPSDLWDEIQSRLDSHTDVYTYTEPKYVLPHSLKGVRLTSRVLALAATILVVVGIGAVVYQLGYSPDHRDLVANFSQYASEYAASPYAAQEMLLASYHGRATTMKQAAATLGYEPLAARGLPPGYSVDKVYLLDMPCCTCAQVVCRNERGHSIAVFEHAVVQPVWFGERPAIECLCQDTPMHVVQLGDRLAATWKAGKRYITVVGATDLDEVAALVAQLRDAGTDEG